MLSSSLHTVNDFRSLTAEQHAYPSLFVYSDQLCTIFITVSFVALRPLIPIPWLTYNRSLLGPHPSMPLLYTCIVHIIMFTLLSVLSRCRIDTPLTPGLNTVNDFRSFTDVPSPDYYTHAPFILFARIFFSHQFFITYPLFSRHITRTLYSTPRITPIDSLLCSSPPPPHTHTRNLHVCIFVSTHRRWQSIVFTSQRLLAVSNTVDDFHSSTNMTNITTPTHDLHLIDSIDHLLCSPARHYLFPTCRYTPRPLSTKPCMLPARSLIYIAHNHRTTPSVKSHVLFVRYNPSTYPFCSSPYRHSDRTVYYYSIPFWSCIHATTLATCMFATLLISSINPHHDDLHNIVAATRYTTVISGKTHRCSTPTSSRHSTTVSHCMYTLTYNKNNPTDYVALTEIHPYFALLSSLSCITTHSFTHLTYTNQSYHTPNVSSHTNKAIHSNEEHQRLTSLEPETFVLSETDTIGQREQLIEEGKLVATARITNTLYTALDNMDNTTTKSISESVPSMPSNIITVDANSDRVTSLHKTYDLSASSSATYSTNLDPKQEKIPYP